MDIPSTTALDAKAGAPGATYLHIFVSHIIIFQTVTHCILYASQLTIHLSNLVHACSRVSAGGRWRIAGQNRSGLIKLWFNTEGSGN